MPKFKEVLKQRYSNKTMSDFDDIENSPSEYSSRRRKKKRSGKSTGQKFTESMTPERNIKGAKAIRTLEQRKGGLPLAPTSQEDIKSQFGKALERKRLKKNSKKY